MKCKKCRKEYPSKYYFKTKSVCVECYEKLNPEEKHLIEKSDHLISPHKEATTLEIMGYQLKCPVCRNEKFWTRKTLLNTPGLTFLGLDWANKEAENYICDRCGYILWFFRDD